MHRKIALISTAAAAFLVSGAFATETVKLPAFQPKAEYVLFFTVDGLDRDYIAKGAAPNISAWEKSGTVFPDVLNVFPTLTSPNMCSLVTGALPITTTIGSNVIYLKEEKRVAEKLRHNKAVTIAEAFKKQGHSTAAMQHFMLENRGTDRYRHTGMFPNESKANSRDVTTHTLEMLKEKVPTLFAVLYQTVDSVGHKFGQDSKEVLDETRFIDAEIATIVNQYRELGLLEKTLVVITADHGMSSISKKIDMAALNTAITNGGWSYAMLTAKSKPPSDADFYILNQGNLQCYFNRPFSTEEKNRLFSTFQKIEGIATVFDAITLRRMGAHPNAGDFLVGPAEGYWTGGSGGVHGRNWESDGYQLMFGPGIKAGGSVEGTQTIDVMPTVLKLFDIPLPDTVDGDVVTSAIIQ